MCFYLTFPVESYEEDEYPAKNVISTRFHIILQTNAGLRFTDRFDGTTAAVLVHKLSGEPCKLFGDSETFWITWGNQLYEIVLPNEEDGVWKKFLELQRFESALQYCSVRDVLRKSFGLVSFIVSAYTSRRRREILFSANRLNIIFDMDIICSPRCFSRNPSWMSTK